jgi:hypothetical protein
MNQNNRPPKYSCKGIYPRRSNGTDARRRINHQNQQPKYSCKRYTQGGAMERMQGEE